MEGSSAKSRERLGLLRTGVKTAGGSRRRASRFVAWNLYRRWERLADSRKLWRLRVAGMAGRTARLEEIGKRLEALAQCALALKEDLQAELAECASPKAGEDQASSQEVSVLASKEASQHSELPVSLPQLQTASSRATEAVRLGGDRDQYLSMLDGILKNQEALRKILMNQDTLKGLVDGLLKAVTNIEARVHTIEREMGLLSRFTEELNAVDTETNWG